MRAMLVGNKVADRLSAKTMWATAAHEHVAFGAFILAIGQ
jgi:hypothetical protein